MYSDIQIYVKSCLECQRSKMDKHTRQPPLHPIPPEEAPFDRVHMNFLGPLKETKEGYKYILLIIDSFTKFPEAFPTFTQFPLDIALVPSAELGRTINEHIEDFLEKPEFVHDIAKENIQLAQKKYKHQHDKRAKEPDFYEGQRVWLYNPATPKGSNPKMIQRWGGPYCIVLANNNHTYCLRDCKENDLHKGLVHARHLEGIQ